MSKWDEGKKVWAEVRTAIRDGVRTVSLFQSSNLMRRLLTLVKLSIPSTSPISASSPSMASSTPIDLGEVSPVEDEKSQTNGDPARTPATTPARTSSTANSTPYKRKAKAGDPVADRTDELFGLLVGFAFALQLVESRPRLSQC